MPHTGDSLAAPAARYPNSGLILGTRTGFMALAAALWAMPSFPCCAAPFAQSEHAPSSLVGCLVEDQGCLQAALLTGMVPHRLDTRSDIFWNVGYTHPSRVSLSGGKLVPRGGAALASENASTVRNAACILHFNGGRRSKWSFRMLSARVGRHKKATRTSQHAPWIP